MKKDEIELQLLKEYVKESLLIESDPLFRGGVGGRILRRGLDAAKGTGGAVLGRAKKFGASIQHLLRGVLALGGETLTAGALTANMDAINADYLKQVQEIDRDYGPYMKQVNKKFGENISPLFWTTLFLNPAFAVKALGVKAAANTVAKKSLEKTLKAGSSEKFQKIVDSYFGKLRDEASKTNLKSFGVDEDKFKSKSSSERDQILGAVQNEKKQAMIRRLESERKKLQGLGATPDMLKRYDDLAKDLKSSA